MDVIDLSGYHLIAPGSFPSTLASLYLRKGGCCDGRGNGVGRAFSLYLTSGTTLYFVRNESVVLCPSLRKHRRSFRSLTRPEAQLLHTRTQADSRCSPTRVCAPFHSSLSLSLRSIKFFCCSDFSFFLLLLFFFFVISVYNF